jgi:hypothetical protein
MPTAITTNGAGHFGSRFRVGQHYSRADVYALCGVKSSQQGGDWDTGYHQHHDTFFVFCNVGAPGRTGHDYKNEFDGDRLLWYAKNGTRRGQPQIERLLKEEREVLIFFRRNDREHFTYQGRAAVASVWDAKGSTPVRVLWRFASVTENQTEQPIKMLGRIMNTKTPSNAQDVKRVIDERLRALENMKGAQETVTIEWRGSPRTIPVISMPTELLSYNPDTHRIRAQRSTNPVLEASLEADPYGAAAQGYLHNLLMGDPSDPTTVDPSFIALKEDLKEHSQSDPGIVTRAGVLINGNTRQAALKEIGERNIRVGVLPPDAAHDDIQSIELSLQLRKDHRREYSFMNFLLAVDERAVAGQLAANIQSDFRIKATTYERMRWILGFVREAIARSKVGVGNGAEVSMRLVDFEAHQGKLEELYRAYTALKAKSPDHAEALREQRLLALLLNKSKTDLRLIEADFADRFMKGALPNVTPSPAAPQVRIPGTSISVAGPSDHIRVLRQFTTDVLRARSIVTASSAATPSEISGATALISNVDQALVKGLEHAGKQGRVVKRRFAPSDRVSDACDDLDLAIAAVAEARASRNFDPADVDESILALKMAVEKLAAIVTRGVDESASESIVWLRALGQLIQNR